MLQRNMFFFERLMYVDGYTPVNCIITAKIEGRLSEEQLRAALDKVQVRHPMLCATVIERDGEPCFVLHSSPPPISLRVVERKGEEDWRTETAAEWKAPFWMDREPMVRLVWIRTDHDISELMLVGHHCVCDGASLVTILGELLMVIDQPEHALPPYPLFKSLHDLVPREVLADRKMAVNLWWKSTMFRLFALTVKDAEPRSAGEHYLIYWKADPQISETFVRRCKSEGTSPYAAMCVAFLESFRRVSGKKFRNKLMCPVNIRRFMPLIDSDVMFNYAPTVPLRLGRKTADFWQRARILRQSMTRKIERLNAYEHLLTAEQLQPSVSKLISLLLQSRGSYDCAFSNVGRIDIPESYSRFRLENILGVTVALPWRNATTIVSTQFRGQIDIAFISTHGFLPYSEAAAIQQGAVDLLSQAVAV